MKKKKFDWVKFILHAFCGAILGSIIGLSANFLLQFFFDFTNASVMIFFAIIYALVAGFKGDDFWYELRR